MARTGRAGKSLELARPACQFDKLTYLLDLNNLWKHQMYTAKSDYKKKCPHMYDKA